MRPVRRGLDSIGTSDRASPEPAGTVASAGADAPSTETDTSTADVLELHGLADDDPGTVGARPDDGAGRAAQAVLARLTPSAGA